MTHAEPRPTTESLWTLAAALLARFVATYVTARAFARMLRAPTVLVRDALNRVKAIETLARRLLLAQALTLTVAPRAMTARPATKRATPSPARMLGDDPAQWRVCFQFGALRNQTNQNTPPVAPPREARHPIFGKPERVRAPRAPQAFKPYDPVAARRWRQARKAAKERAWREYWLMPKPPPYDGPSYIELPLSNATMPHDSTLPIARRMEALARVIADPLAYAMKLAKRLAARVAEIPELIARLRTTHARATGCRDAMTLFEPLTVSADDTS